MKGRRTPDHASLHRILLFFPFYQTEKGKSMEGKNDGSPGPK